MKKLELTSYYSQDGQLVPVTIRLVETPEGYMFIYPNGDQYKGDIPKKFYFGKNVDGITFK